MSALSLSGCSGDAEPAPAPHTSSAPTSPTASPSPTPPVMPEAAKAHTEAGAKAFVEYFWEVVNYAQATGDTAALKTLTSPDCSTCAAGITSIESVYADGGRIVGGNASIRDLAVTLSESHATHLATVTFRIDIDPQRTDYPGVKKDKNSPARAARDQFHLIARGDSLWDVATFRVLK